MVDKEIFGNGFVRFVAAPDMHGAQVVYLFAGDGRCIATLHAADVVSLADAFAVVADDADPAPLDAAIESDARVRAAVAAEAMERAFEIVENAAAIVAARKSTTAAEPLSSRDPRF